VAAYQPKINKNVMRVLCFLLYLAVSLRFARFLCSGLFHIHNLLFFQFFFPSTSVSVLLQDPTKKLSLDV